jgi:hypothetical protein
VLTLACTLAALGLVAWLHRRERRIVASLAGLTTIGLAIVLLIVNTQWWRHFPRLIQTVQIPGPLVPYLAIVIGLVMIIALTTLRSGRICLTLIAAMTVAVGSCAAAAPCGSDPAEAPGRTVAGRADEGPPRQSTRPDRRLRTRSPPARSAHRTACRAGPAPRWRGGR